ncbi:SDR family oxidoreductase [Aquitalea magnusonii]
MAMSVVVTGAAHGIGQAVAMRLAAEGRPLVLVDSDATGLAGTAKALPADVPHRLVTGSVAERATADAAAAAAHDLGGASGLSHNAGIQRYGSALDTTQDCWDEVIATNLSAAFLLSQALLPQLIVQRGAMVFMASVQGLASQRHVAAYTASKHGLIGLSKSIAVDFASQGVRANAVAPGAIDTPMLRDAIASAPSPAALRREIDAMHPLGRAGHASEVAELVAFLLSDRATFITGEVIRIDGGLLALIGGSPSQD